MTKPLEKETIGAWIIHHGQKLNLDTHGPAEFPSIDEAAKAATLLTKLGQSEQTTVPKSEVIAIAQASGLNPRHELTGLLHVLEQRKLIAQSNSEIAVLGVTTRNALSHAADMFSAGNPNRYEEASITLAERASQAPTRRSEVSEEIGDIHSLSRSQVFDFLDRAETVGFVDKEGIGEDRILFNGNLFRRDTIVKSQRVLESPTGKEQSLVNEVSQHLTTTGCLTASHVEKLLSGSLFEKLAAAGLYDLNKVMNEQGTYVYITAPSAFHKYVNPMIDDCFDMAKLLVAALTYGMNARQSHQGRINALPMLLGKLIQGGEVGPATAIGHDYRVLELNGVVKLRRDEQYASRFYMRLLKKEVGEIALQVLTQGSASEQSVMELPNAPVSHYVGPEESRMGVRRRQSGMSKKTTGDILEAIRGGRR